MELLLNGRTVLANTHKGTQSVAEPSAELVLSELELDQLEAHLAAILEVVDVCLLARKQIALMSQHIGKRLHAQLTLADLLDLLASLQHYGIQYVPDIRGILNVGARIYFCCFARVASLAGFLSLVGLWYAAEFL